MLKAAASHYYKNIVIYKVVVLFTDETVAIFAKQL